MKKSYQQKLAEAGLIETVDDAQARYFRENRGNTSVGTKQKFIAIIQRELSVKDWATDTERLDRAMLAVEKTVAGGKGCFLSESFQQAWREIGKKGKVTYKGIHALPD